MYIISLQEFNFILLDTSWISNWSNVGTNVEHRIGVWAFDVHVSAEFLATLVFSVICAKHGVPEPDCHSLVPESAWVEAVKLVQKVNMDLWPHVL